LVVPSFLGRFRYVPCEIAVTWMERITRRVDQIIGVDHTVTFKRAYCSFFQFPSYRHGAAPRSAQ
jgi:hypothetical protein